MGYDIIHFGTMYLSSSEQAVPRNPTTIGDIPEYHSKQAVPRNPNIIWEYIPEYHSMVRGARAGISFLPAISGPPITWIKPNGLNLLIADRVLLTRVSWKELNENGFVQGKQMEYGGQRFCCRLPQLGADEDIPCEWTDVLSVTGGDDSLWHWTDMFFWGSDAVTWRKSANRAICGNGPTCRWDYAAESEIAEDIGFRPVLEPLGATEITPNCNLDGVNFHLSSLPGDEFYPVLQPVQSNVFVDIPNGQQLKMYTLMEDGQPVHTGEQVKKSAKLTLTDRYFGDEYLVPWIISNGVAVASQSLKQQT